MASVEHRKDYGNTPLIEARELSGRLSLPNLHLKLESRNPTGTHKDRIAIEHVRDCAAKGSGEIIVASCGNYGAAVAYAASKVGISCEVVIPEAFESPRIEEIKSYGAKISRLPLTYEDCVKESSARARENSIYDANPGDINSAFQRYAYRIIAREIHSLIGEPSAVGIPISNGTTLAGVWEGFRELGTHPKMYAGSTKDQNPIVSSKEKGLSRCEVLSPSVLNESEVNEPLINWYSLDGDPALWALEESKGEVYGAIDAELIQLAELVSSLYEPVHPASVAGLLALSKTPIDGPVVAILTSRAY